MRYDNTFVSAELAKLMRLGTRDVGRLPVVDRQNPKRLVGTIRRHDIVRACKVGIGRKLEMQTRGKQLRLGNLTGTEIIDVVVLPQSPAAHRAVKELNLPKGYLMVIAISSCLFTIISIEGFPLRGASQDTARVAAQIVTGVGFLGAGVVLRSKNMSGG